MISDRFRSLVSLRDQTWVLRGIIDDYYGNAGDQFKEAQLRRWRNE